MKYIGYARKSTDEKDKQVLSIDNQVSELKEFAERENLEIVDFLTEAQSAKVTGRPIFNSLVKRIEKGEAQGIVSWNPDRIARNSIDGGKIIYLLDTGELQSLKFPTHWFENTPQGRFMLSIAFGQAKYYVDNLSQNVTRGLKYKIKTGVWPARAPMGYRNDRNSKSIVVYEPEARPLRKAFELYSTGKYALDGIGKFLFENGMKNKYSGGQLNDSNLRRVLMRPFYTGYMVFRGEMFKGTHAPLISKELFDKCQVVRKQRGYYHQNQSKRYNFAFTGLIKCKYCNCSITAEHRPFYFPRTHHKADYLYYHCTKKKGECCQKGYTREEVIAVQFREMIKSLSVSEAWVTRMNNFLVQDVESQKVEDKNTSLSLETEISQTEQKLDTLLEAYLDTVIDSESYTKKKNELMERKANLVSKQKELTSDNPNWIEGVTNFITCAQKCAKIARAENNCHDLADMAKKVGSFLKDKKIEFCLYFPYNLLAANGGAASLPAQSVPTLAFGQSKYYVDNLSENVKRGMKHKVRIGVWPVQAPLGYLNDKNTKTIMIDPVRSKIIRRAFEMFSFGNHSFTSISEYLFELGIKTRIGRKLNPDTIKRMLSNRFYLGILNYKGELHKGIHKPIISKVLFDSAQKQVERFERPRGNKGHNFPFAGLMKCLECRASITGEEHIRNYKRGDSQTFTYYRCTKKLGYCSQKYVRQEEVEHQLREQLSDVTIPQGWWKEWLIRLEQDKLNETKLASLRVVEIGEEMQEVDRKLNKLLDTYLDSIVDEESYKKKKNELFEQKLKLQEKISRIESGGSTWLEPFEEFIKRSINCGKIALGKNNLQDLRDLARNAGSNFNLSDKRLSFVPNLGFDSVKSWRGRLATATPELAKSASV
ncbi:MAG: Recombinase, partial [Parcubacteria group bacterium GW2011_GWA1_38_7]